MATQRYISTSFWDDRWIQTLDPSEKFVYLYLLTNPLTNIAGVYEITIARICFDTGYNQETVERVLGRFEGSKKAYRWQEYIILPSWPKHQRWQQRSKIKAGIISILQNLPPELLKYLKKVRYAYPIDTLSIPDRYHPNYSDTDTDTDLNSDTDSEADIVSPHQPVDNSQTESPDVSAEDVCAAAAEVFNLQLKKGEAEAVAENFTHNKVDTGFITWAEREIRSRPTIKNRAGYARKMLLALDEYTDWIELYRGKARASPPEPARASPPMRECPECGQRVHVSGDELWCPKCKRLLAEYDEDFNIWIDAKKVKTG